MTTCNQCGQPAKAVTQERRRDPGDRKQWLLVTVYHHEGKQCREWAPAPEGERG